VVEKCGGHLIDSAQRSSRRPATSRTSLHGANDDDVGPLLSDATPFHAVNLLAKSVADNHAWHGRIADV